MRHTTEQVRRDQEAYTLAKQYLLSLDDVTPDMIERHLCPSIHERPDSLSGIYRHLLETAQNRGMSPNVIGGAIGGIDQLGSLLCEFEPIAVMEKYGHRPEMVLDDITTQLNREIRRTSRSLWPQFCKTITSGAEFLTQFDKASDFYKWVEFFDQDDRARPALPMLLSYEIDGFGFALACDFIKELGYHDFGKPDVHLKKIFASLGLSSTEHDYQVFKAIVRVARNVETTPYNVDKLFWLIGSGYFYLDDIRVGRHRDDFIQHARNILGYS